MSVSVSEQSFQYFGILNGVMYRIDPSSGAFAQPTFAPQPFEHWSNHVRDQAIVPAVARPTGAPPAPATEPSVLANPCPIEGASAPSKLFPRSGGEPLRAGHPDLWALLVSGTCLEGSTFNSL